MITELNTDHVEAMAAIHATSFERGWSHTDLKTHIKNDTALGACDPDDPQTLKGFIIVRRIYEQAEILTLAVHAGHRRSGVGQHLLSAAETQMHTQGAKAVFLEVAEDNAAAITLYHKAGYVAFHRRPEYYKRKQGRIAALNLSKNLPPLA